MKRIFFLFLLILSLNDIALAQNLNGKEKKNKGYNYSGYTIMGTFRRKIIEKYGKEKYDQFVDFNVKINNEIKRLKEVNGIGSPCIVAKFFALYGLGVGFCYYDGAIYSIAGVSVGFVAEASISFAYMLIQGADGSPIEDKDIEGYYLLGNLSKSASASFSNDIRKSMDVWGHIVDRSYGINKTRVGVNFGVSYGVRSRNISMGSSGLDLNSDRRILFVSVGVGVSVLLSGEGFYIDKIQPSLKSVATVLLENME